MCFLIRSFFKLFKKDSATALSQQLPFRLMLVYYDVDKPDEYLKSRTHGAVQFELTVTDRRSQARLGEMRYVVDLANRRACGANFGHLISHDAFIWDAIDR
jgi:hypothetical protein